MLRLSFHLFIIMRLAFGFAYLLRWAPFFAEECWVLLHYKDERDDDLAEADIAEKKINAELAENEKLRNFSRRHRPEILASIFDQPFPVAEPTKIIKLLNSTRLRLKARAESSTRIKKDEGNARSGVQERSKNSEQH